MAVAEWETSGAALNVLEPYEGGRLSVGYTQNVDTRFTEHILLGPLVNDVDCSSAGGTTASANGAALSHGMNATEYIYVIRGTKWAKIQLSNMSLISDGTETALSEKANGILYTESSNGTEEISIGMAGTAYQVITAVSGGATDTHSANNETQVIRVFGRMGGEASKPRIAGGNGQTVLQNTLESTTTMDGSSWQTRATLPGDVTPTGIALDGTFWIIGTDEGPYYLNNDFQVFTPLITEIGKDSDNCRVMQHYTFLGLLINLSTGSRYMRAVTEGRSFGPEVYDGNTSPVQGRMSGFAATERWGYMAIKNDVEDDVYICAIRPRQLGDWHGNPVSFYPIIHFSNTDCEFLAFTDKAGGRTNPTLVGGKDSDVFWITLGRIAHEHDDGNYRFATSGTWYGTEMRRDPLYDKYPEAFELETEDCDSNKTVQVKISVDGGTAVDCGAPITRNGLQRVKIPSRLHGRRLQPVLEFSSNSSTATPKVYGNLRMKYQQHPVKVDGKAFLEESP